MKFPFYIAKRYIFSKKSHNIINIISGISIVGIGVGTMSLIIILSVFNGFEKLVTSLFSSFNPEFEISVKEGKVFTLQDSTKKAIMDLPGVIYWSDVIEEHALLEYDNNQYVARIKGVGPLYVEMIRLDTLITHGKYLLKHGDISYAVVGQGVAYHLGLNLNDQYKSIKIYMPKRNKKVLLDPSKSFNIKNIFPAGEFSVQQEVDEKYIIVPLDFARELTDYKDEVSAIEIGLNESSDIDFLQKKIKEILGNDYDVKNRFEQQEQMYKIMKSEKLSIVIILTFIIIIAIFNIVGTLTMLILDKKEDISVLQCLGANNQKIKRIFLLEGMMISIIGSVSGLILGALICFLQQTYGFITIQSSGSFIINTYPVHMIFSDFILAFCIVIIISGIASWLPVRRVSNKYLSENKTI